MDRIEDLELRIMEIDDRLKPIGNRPFDFNDPKWIEKLRSVQPPLDEAGVRNEVESLLREILHAYASSDHAARESLRAMFSRHRFFTWAAAIALVGDATENFRQQLLLFSLKDQGQDTRDAILTLQELCRAASAAGVQIDPMLNEVAALSSDHNKYGMGSTRKLLLDASAGRSR